MSDAIARHPSVSKIFAVNRRRLFWHLIDRIPTGGYDRGVNRRRMRIVFGGVMFVLWVLCAVFMVRFDLARGSFGPWTIIILLVTGFLAFMRVVRVWFNQPPTE
jgi:hypothetical protein